jgi:hypothetical protein
MSDRANTPRPNNHLRVVADQVDQHRRQLAQLAEQAHALALEAQRIERDARLKVAER